ncbi:UPF0175 family protein [Halomarina oriensis]|uniref:Uncharacterized protein n=1 Tax=Halomarina oriensis TaxID=671145 RepID=A0A6B0GK82_9EURY|nr:UPF0175 family protein [Halomarina oriensis]MWG35020.1 hypothetical protein [Halomarina oriensis]
MSRIDPGGSPDQFGGPQGPLGPIQNEFKKLNLFFGLIFEDPEVAVREISQEILSMDEHERFTTSIEVFEDRFAEAVGDIEALQALAPNVDGDRVLLLFDSMFEDMLERLFSHVNRKRSAETLVVLVAGVLGVQAGVRELDSDGLSDERKRQIISSILAFLIRLQTLLEQDEPDESDIRALTRDVGVAIYYIDEGLDGESNFPDPASAEYATIRRAVLEFGAVAVYSNMPISLGRGAELADTSRFEFEESLDAYDVELRSGPSSVDELHNDGVGLVNE